MELYGMEEFRRDNKPSNIPAAPTPVTNGSLEQQRQPKKHEGAKGLVHRFFHYTTINGLQRLASASTIIGRLFWIVVVLGALGMFSRDLYFLIVQYYEKPITVVSKINYFKKMPFPAVTVCNVNPIRNGVYNFEQLEEKIKEKNENYCFREDLRNDTCEEDVDEHDDFEDDINYILTTGNETILQTAGHQQKDLILSCRFNGIRCRRRVYWTQFWDPKYGNCYTLNGRLRGYGRNISLFSADKPGNSNGLRMVLNIEVDRYIPEITEDAGVKVVIGGPREMPFPLYQSISVAPGLQTDISLKRIQIKRVDRYNNGSCRESKVLEKTNHYLKRYNVSYSIQACLHECYANSQLALCGCAEYAYLTATPSGKVCDETDRSVEKCLNKWRLDSGSCDKTCKEPCEETIFESRISFTRWPSPKSVEGVLRNLGKNFSDYGDNIQRVWDNYLSVNIFFERFRETNIEESLSYETPNLLADIGGNIGLWAGLSVISMCELIELAALLARNCFRGRNRTN